MKRHLFCTLLFVFATIFEVAAQQPMGGCWHPEDIKDWSPENDPEAKFNRSVVALKERFVDKTVKAGPNSFFDSKITACLTMNPMCSQTPSQGANSFTGYTFNFWQYVDILVWWGGSASEGVIIPPSAPVVDAAHKNGVQVYGNVFFPPGAFGGQSSWVREMMTQENGEFPYAKRLAEIANYYGFDGWFINEETYASSKAEWAGFAKTFNKYKGSDHMGLQWYDASTSIPESLFKGKEMFSSMFLNYGSASSSSISRNNKSVESWGMDPFSVNYYGLEIGGGGFSHKREFTSLFSKDKNNGSVALFCPEEKTWKDHTKRNDLNQYEQMAEFYKTAGRFWVNINHDVTSKTAYDDSNWPGISVGVAARSVINTFPFVTNFNTGMGKKRFVKGTVKGTGDWYHRGIQDILPTWRWWIEGSRKTVEPTFTWDDSYNSGASLMFTGNLDANISNNIRLFKTQLEVVGSEQAQIVVKGAKTGYSCSLGLAFKEDNNAFTYLPLENFADGSWKTITLPLSAYAGKTISMISIKLESKSNVQDIDLKVGQLFLGSNVTAAGEVSNLKIIDDKNVEKVDLGDTKGSARIIWDAAKGDVNHYNIYMEQNGTQSLVGQTMDEAFYIGDIIRTNSRELSVKFTVKSVDLKGNESTGVEKSIDWLKPSVPEVKIVGDKSYIEVGETVLFTARATQYPETYNWTLPKGAVKAEVKCEKNQIAVTFNTKGNFDISVKVTNSLGSTEQKLETAATVVEMSLLEVVSVGKTIDSYSDCIAKHNPKYLIDGQNIPSSLDYKWCVGGSKSQWVIIDLEEPFDIYGFKAYDTGHKESADGNYDCWKVEISNDKKQWTEVVNEKGRKAENTKVDAIPGKVGRYVRFTPYDKDLNITIRIWEFQVLGVSMGMNFVGGQNLVMSEKGTKTVKFAYDLGLLEKAKDFGFSAASANGNIKVSNEVIDEANKTYQFDIQSKDGFFGAEKVKVTFVNGGLSKDISFVVTVENSKWANVLKGKKVQAYTANWYWNGIDAKITGGEKLIDGDLNTGIKTNYNKIVLEADLEEVTSLSCFRYNGSQDGKKLKLKVTTSEDGKSFTEAFSTQYVGGSLYILNEPINARYIQVWTSRTGWSTVTIQEVVVLGTVNNFSFGEVASQNLKLDETKVVKVPFTNKVDVTKDMVTASVANENLVEVANIELDAPNNMLNVTLTGKHAIGNTTVTLTTKIGEDRFTKSFDVSVTPAASTNLALNKSAVDFSGSTTNELPSYLFDGETVPTDNSHKWCETGNGPHYVVVDLEKVYTVFEFKMFDCGNVEDADWNSQGYTIEVSEDNINWTVVAEDVKDNSTTKDIVTNGINARYVKYTTGGDDGHGTIRLFEFEVYGVDDLSLSSKNTEGVELKVYPNPATDFIEVKGISNRKVSVKVFDILGNEELFIPNYDGQKINVKALPNGVHAVRIDDGEKVTYTKIMKL
ncbi:discoidin domain-containing protein [Halosquirtibacter laminarini]|uniref:Discoidin domain-containing protein n=1 Tax=Halosquirtibacter laminarini TaxID=3374600 RepID=A0AC61NGL2_9BACT|nr:discoidin domain-containing protein [Prolixibacteraceae bacterium]